MINPSSIWVQLDPRCGSQLELGGRQEVSLSGSCNSPFYVWKGPVSVVSSKFQSFTSQKVTELEISWTPNQLNPPGITNTFHHPLRAIWTLSCFYSERKMGLPSCYCPISTRSVSRACCWLLKLRSAFRQWHLFESRFQKIGDSPGFEMKLIWLALLI